MRYLSFTIIVLLCVVYPSIAAVIVVDSNPGATHADYTYLQEAIYAADDYDTLYFVGSCVGYGSGAATKPLTLIGPGYFLGENDDPPAHINHAFITNLQINDECPCYIAGFKFTNALTVVADNTIITRNYFEVSHNCAISIDAGAGNVFIVDNYIVNIHEGINYSAISLGISSNVTIANNYIYKATFGSTIYSSEMVSNLLIYNNILHGGLDVYNAEIFNNIMTRGDYEGHGSSVHHNLTNEAQFGDTDGNIPNVDMGAVFVGTGSTDGQWQLAANSVAIGAGYNGVDCGIFGGASPYVLSGIPAIPEITAFFAPATASEATGLPVNITIKARN